MPEFQDLPDDIIERFSQAASNTKENLFTNVFDDYEQAEHLADELFLQDAHIGEIAVISRVVKLIKQKAAETGVNLPSFDTVEEPIVTKNDLAAYNPTFSDFYYSVLDLIEDKRRRSR